jgi:EAL domain-containing protein (putative c-di-GMP-specific phosphodiesterase class I)
MTPVWPERTNSHLEAVQGPGLLYLRFERDAPLLRAAGALLQVGIECHRKADVLTVKAGHDVTVLVHTLRDALFAGDLEKTRVIWERGGHALSLRDCFDVGTLHEWLARAQSDWFLSMLRESRFETHFQPIVSVTSPSEIFGYEGLLRGRHGENMVSPAPLFEVASGLRLRRELDTHALQTALRHAGAHGMSGRVFLNCLPSTLDDSREAVELTLAAVDATQIKREQVVLEVVECECADDLGVLQNTLDGLREAGLKIALDDLGAGYASLNLLQCLRPDFVKLDRDLVTGVDRDPFKALIVQKLLETAQGLGIRTVAEGVETGDEWNWIRAHGADYAQGFFFARPAQVPPCVPPGVMLH